MLSSVRIMMMRNNRCTVDKPHLGNSTCASGIRVGKEPNSSVTYSQIAGYVRILTRVSELTLTPEYKEFRENDKEIPSSSLISLVPV